MPHAMKNTEQKNQKNPQKTHTVHGLDSFVQIK